MESTNLLHEYVETLTRTEDARCDCGSAWTLSRINNRANQFARSLINLGAKPGRTVGVFLPLSVNHIVATLAVFKTGATAVPLDVELSAQSTAVILAYARVQIVITATPDARPSQEWAGIGFAQLPISEIHFVDSSIFCNLGIAIDPDATACMIFTTSTGSTKAVRLSHSQLVRYAMSFAESVGLHWEELDSSVIIEEKLEAALNINLTRFVDSSPPGAASSPHQELVVKHNGDLLAAINITNTWHHISECATHERNATACDIPLLPNAHLDGLIYQFNRLPSRPNINLDCDSGNDTSLLIHKLEEHATKHPQKTAIRWYINERILKTSYSELNDRANKLARHIDRFYRGQADSCAPSNSEYQAVVLCTGQNPTHLTGLLGILKSGRAYVPVDPTAPAERIAYIIGQCCAQLIVCDDESKSLLRSLGTTARLVPLGADFWDSPGEMEGAAEVAKELSGRITTETLAYVIFTSGSTGVPKGCLIHHGGLTNTTKHVWPEGTGDQHSRYIQAFSTAFDGHVPEWAPAIWNGGSLCIPESRQLLLGEGFRRINNMFKITHASCTPSMLSSVPVGPMPSLKALIIAAEAMPRQLLDKWMPVLNPAGETRCVVQNCYGPTECTVAATKYTYVQGDGYPDDSTDGDGDSLLITRHPVATVGRPLLGATIYILDNDLRPCPIGGIGEVFIGGKGVGFGYLGLPEQTAAKFLPNPWHGGRMYRTGDLGRWMGDGTVHMLGRKDNQVKVRGHRIELEEIETTLCNHPLVIDCKVLVLSLTASGPAGSDSMVLVAFIALRNGSAPTNWIGAVRTFVAATLPSYMCPSRYHVVEQIPKTINAKVDSKALEQIDKQAMDKLDSLSSVSQPSEARVDSTEESVIRAFRKVLHVEFVTSNDDFFSLGGNSLLALQLAKEFPEQVSRLLSAHHVFRHRTVRALAAFIDQLVSALGKPLSALSTAENDKSSQAALHDENEAAIIGISILAPGCTDAESYWSDVLSAGTDCLSRRTKEELHSEGLISKELLDSDSFVPVMGRLGSKENPVDVFGFDASLFGMKDANAVALMDPQHRHFLQVVWHALEDAAIQVGSGSPRIGVFASCGTNNYLTDYIQRQDKQQKSASQRHRTVMANDKDFIALQASYHLNLTGPAMTVQTACSSSLAAVHAALNSLRLNECQVSIAGGVSLGALHQAGYLYEPGLILAKDGICRPFAEDACGTVRGAGVCAVVLKPLRDAIRDKDRIYAVIHGSAMNNDGRADDKASFMAPSVSGQSTGLLLALNASGLHDKVETIGMWECHATGTRVGDPAEVEAMRSVFSGLTQSKNFCAIGSVKSQIGHLDAAAGVAGLIKSALAIHHAKIPATIHVNQVNQDLGLADSAFYLNTCTKDWPQCKVRRAGVTSLGIGGTNVYQVLEQAPAVVANNKSDMLQGSQRKLHILPFSSRSQRSTLTLAQHMATYLHPPDIREEPKLSSVAFTMQKRRSHPTPAYRGFILATTSLEAAKKFEWLGQQFDASDVHGKLASRLALSVSLPENYNGKQRQVVFMFAGQGTQFPGMGVRLYDEEPIFRKHVDELISNLQKINVDLGLSASPLTVHDLWDPEGAGEQPLHTIAVGLFVLQLATAKSLMEVGVAPAVVIGHSLGQYSAACIAGIMSEETAMRIVVNRALLMANMREGAMMSICGQEQQVWSG